MASNVVGSQPYYPPNPSSQPNPSLPYTQQSHQQQQQQATPLMQQQQQQQQSMGSLGSILSPGVDRQQLVKIATGLFEEMKTLSPQQQQVKIQGFNPIQTEAWKMLMSHIKLKKQQSSQGAGQPAVIHPRFFFSSLF